MRVLGDQRWLIMLNFFAEECQFALPQEVMFQEARLVIGNYGEAVPAISREIRLRPYEARVFELH